ncbi:MAG TPA: Rho termination factor N-terminal domain-containing protein [Solirubrobacteraceae bacterium]|jgi:transcription termination factor Rho
MAVLERSELEASPLADLHAIADQIGLEGFRRLRKAELVDAILGGSAGGAAEDTPDGEEPAASERPRRRRPARPRRARASAEDEEESEATGEEPAATEEPAAAEERQGETTRRRSSRTRRPRAAAAAESEPAAESSERPRRRGASGGREERAPAGDQPADRSVEGVVELLGNGSAFLRVSPPEASDDDVYISAAQVRRCELVSGDKVSGPVRPRRSSERYPSLARVDTINGDSAESVAEGTRYEDLPVAYPAERLELDSSDATLSAIEWLTPIGRGSRVLIVGAARAGKTEMLLRLRDALAGREGLEVMVVLSGVRPEEISAWREDAAPVLPAAALNLAASADLQGQTVEHVVETAKRVAARGGDVVVLIDSLDGLHPHVARKILANARNLSEGGSLTLIATATRPLGGESTVIALDVTLTSTGRMPALDLAASGTVKPELLVGEDGAEAITKARAAAIEAQRR